MKKLDSNLLGDALTLLAELTRDETPQHFVVCGGSSLLALGLVRRSTTRDIDVLARVESDNLVTVDTDQGRHYQDLKDLNPTAEELLAAARWPRTQDPSEGFLSVLSNVLKSLGHEYLIEQL